MGGSSRIVTSKSSTPPTDERRGRPPPTIEPSAASGSEPVNDIGAKTVVEDDGAVTDGVTVLVLLKDTGPGMGDGTRMEAGFAVAAGNAGGGP